MMNERSMSDAAIDLVVGTIRDSAWHMETLRVVRDLGLPDWAIGAGFVRNAVWDRLHGFQTNTQLADIDVLHFDRDVLLDACRNNPFTSGMKVTSASRSVSRGFARVEPSRGTLISFSAKDGTTADDGEGCNSPYTAALLQHLEQPGLELQFMFRKVRDKVLDATSGRQEPFTYGSLPVYLVKPETAEPNAQSGTSSDRETVFWTSIKDSKDPAAFEAPMAPLQAWRRFAAMTCGRARPA